MPSSNPLYKCGDACVVVPARYASSRFPGKPLADILGVPMVLRVCERAACVVGSEHTYVATDSGVIADVVIEAGFQIVMTSETALTGTDRVAMASETLDYKYYINVQGDEPLVNPADILRCLAVKKENQNFVINGYADLAIGEDPDDMSIPKVVMDRQKNLIYISRAAIPSSKLGKVSLEHYKKQICIYVFSSDELMLFRGLSAKGALEQHEDIEIIRFLELGLGIRMVKCANNTIAVDYPGDVQKVEAILIGEPAN